MDYSTLVPIALGGLLALGGGFLGQWWAERRAVAREQRDREHEREVWVRGLAYEAHVQFIGLFQRLYRAVEDARDRGDHTEPPEEYLAPLHHQLTSLRLVSQQATQDEALRAIIALHGFTHGGAHWEVVEKQLDRYLSAVREEFHLSPIELWEDGPGAW